MVSAMRPVKVYWASDLDSEGSGQGGSAKVRHQLCNSGSAQSEMGLEVEGGSYYLHFSPFNNIYICVYIHVHVYIYKCV